MILRRRITLAVLLTGSLSMVLVCANIQQAKDTNDLKPIGLAYHNSIDTNRKPPEKASDITMFLEGPASEPSQGLASGKYVVYWGTKSPKEGGTSQIVLGHRSDVAASGGPVLMLDGSVMMMTAAEFATAKKGSGK
jgi:hypothetical protein